jgi:cyclase
MLRPRIIPCLLIHDGGLVKTVGFSKPKYVGDPVNAVKIFNEKESDELLLVDIDCTVQGREPNFRLISQVAAECRMPLCYGGGIKSLEQAKRLISSGVEKVAVSSAAIEDPALVARIAESVGSQSIAVVLDVKKHKAGNYELWTHRATKNTHKDAIETAVQMAALGAGEIVINSIDLDGAMTGYDLVLAAKIRAAVSTPITLLGGAGSLDDIGKLFQSCGIVGAAAGSLFVFKGLYRAVLINYPGEISREDLIRRAFKERGQLTESGAT